jgi:hypothetical protein
MELWRGQIADNDTAGEFGYNPGNSGRYGHQNIQVFLFWADF